MLKLFFLLNQQGEFRLPSQFISSDAIELEVSSTVAVLDIEPLPTIQLPVTVVTND